MHLVQELPKGARRAFEGRLGTIVSTLTDAGPLEPADAVEALTELVGSAHDLLWLAYAVLAAELPTDDDMTDLLIRARLGGTWAALSPVLPRLADGQRFREVEVLRSTVTCDVHTTAGSHFLSGIQRVVRETTTRWQSVHDVAFLGWTRDLTGLRRVREEEYRRMFGDLSPTRSGSLVSPVVVPWESTHVWVEVITDVRRTSRLLALTQHSRNEVAVLGYDSIPVTSSVTVAPGMTSHFARGLAAVRQADRVAMISEAAAVEFRGVMAMGAGRRERGPVVQAVPLAVGAPAATPADVLEAQTGLIVEGMPMVLVVGSHEPRKNHLSVLHAAEMLWREGRAFNLVLVGAGSWNASGYEQALSGLLAAGRPIQSIRALPDRLLWAAYRLAHCTLFPSLNEGFGLPVAESLAAGTPVITSDYGCMRDIVAPRGEPLGALLVDPRDDESLRDALRVMLTDRAVYDRLKSETAAHEERTWDEYATELWSFLVDGAPSEA